jgi:iterative type I PKS product template protein
VPRVITNISRQSFIPGGNRAFIPGRINYFYKFSGPSYAVDTACSSSLAAVHIACNSLWARDIDTAITGGTNILTNPDFTAGLDRGYFLSRTGNCKTFDDAADGYCRGEGVGTVILKRLEDAVADKDPILGLILGAYTNHSAEAESITRPHSGAQRAMFNKILNSSQDAVDPSSVSYIEMHGTGTQAGDASEMQSVLETFAPSVGVRNDTQPLYLGSAKANIGHGEAASGVSSLIKIMLMMRENTIPPHCGIKSRINHKFPKDLNERNVRIAREGPVPWQRSASQPRRVFVNNFSAAGGNTALLVEDAPLISALPGSRGNDARTSHLVAISAKNALSLEGNLQSLLRFIQQNPEASINELSYTTTARRIHHPHRVMLATPCIDDLRIQVEAAIRDKAGANRPKVHKIVFAFTGQGAQFAGMGRLYFENFSTFRTEIRRLDHLGQCLGFPSVIPVLEADESENILDSSPVAVQLASICMQIALAKLLASWNIFPAAVVGHSLGEYAALNAAGVLSDADTIYLVGRRAELIQEKCSQGTHSMLVVRASANEIEDALRNKDIKYEFACVNSPTETVLAGSVAEVDKAEKVLDKSGIRTTILKVPYAFHSSQVEPILEKFSEVASGATFSAPSVPVIRPLSGTTVLPTDTDVGFSPEYLAKHCREPVNMLKALQTAQEERVITNEAVILEVGPHPAVSAMVKATLGSHLLTLPTSQRTSSAKQSKSPWQVLTDSLKRLYSVGTDIRWAEYHRDFTSAHKVVPLPAYSWDLKDYWIQYVNDWSLRKGDPPLILGSSSRLDTTTIHRIVDETSGSNGNSVNIVVEADVTRPDMNPLIQGHMVDNIPLCTPSVYADMALSLGKYLVEKYQPQLSDDQLVVDVGDMTISKALIAKPQGPQPLQAHAEVDWTSKEATCKFLSFDNKGQLQEHARCVIRFQDRAYQRKLQGEAALIKEKMQALRKGIASETTARFNRPMVYRMIRPLAQFHTDYRAIDEFVLNSNTLEASSRVSFGSVKRNIDDRFHTHPAIIDALSQSCGFVMNCNDGCDLDVEVFMNHGWGSFQIYEEMKFEKAYTTYTRMQEGKDRLWHGDVAVFDGDKIVASFQQLAVSGSNLHIRL